MDERISHGFLGSGAVGMAPTNPFDNLTTSSSNNNHLYFSDLPGISLKEDVNVPLWNPTDLSNHSLKMNSQIPSLVQISSHQFYPLPPLMGTN